MGDWKANSVRGIGRCHKGIRGSELEEIRQFSYIIGYTDIILTPYSAEAHNALPLRSARRRGADVGDKRNETFLEAGSYY